MKNITLIILLIITSIAYGQDQKTVKDITYLNKDAIKVQRYIENNEGNLKKAFYISSTNQYINCDKMGDFVPHLVPNNWSVTESKCRCSRTLPANTQITLDQLELNEHILGNVTSYSRDLNNKWNFIFNDLVGINFSCNPENKFLYNYFSKKNFAAYAHLKKNKACAIDDIISTESEIYSNKRSVSGVKIVNDICAANGGLRPNFEVYSAPVKNACAVQDNGNKRYIFFSDEYFSKKSLKKTKSKWAAYFIFAHEIAHHLNADVLDDTTSIQVRMAYEHDADRWAGYALHMLGAPLKHTTSWVRNKASEKGDTYHETRDMRLKAVEEGWNSLSEVPITKQYWLSVGTTFAFCDIPSSDASFFNSVDMMFHVPYHKILPHFALGLNYCPFYQISYRANNTGTTNGNSSMEYIDPSNEDDVTSSELVFIDHFLLTAKAYVANYFRSNYNGSLSFSQGTRMRQFKFATNYTAFSKRIDFELFLAPTAFNFTNDDNFQTWKLLWGCSANYCFFNKNNKPKINFKSL